MPRIVAEFSSDDPTLAGVLKLIDSFPEYSPERAEMEALLHIQLARVSWREADQLRALADKREARLQRCDREHPCELGCKRCEG